MTQSLGFIGLGIMGSSMCKNLMKAGHNLTVYGRRPQAVEEIVRHGARKAFSPKEVGEKSEVVLLCLSDDNAVKEVVCGEHGILSGEISPRFIVDHSTASPSLATRLAEMSRTKEVTFVDAPVTGGDVGAREGTLTVMLGCQESDFEYLKTILLGLGKNIIRTGSVGSGQRTKCINQVACALSTVALIESLALAEGFSLDPQTTLGIISSGAAASWTLNNYGPRVLKGDFNPGFPVKHMVKDLKIVLDEADSLGLPMPLTQLVRQLYIMLQSKEGGELGTQSLLKLYREWNSKR